MDTGQLTDRALKLSLPAVTASVRPARDTVADFARAHGASAHVTEAVRLAASEALTNVVLHAYEPPPKGGVQTRPVHLTAAAAGEELWVLVADEGDGFRANPTSPGLGLGLIVIAQVCDEFTVIRRTGGGTELRMRFSMERGEAGMAAHRPPSPPESS